MQPWTYVKALTLFQEIHLLQISPYPQVGYAYSELLVCQLSHWEPYWSFQVWETDRLYILLNVCILRACYLTSISLM